MSPGSFDVSQIDQERVPFVVYGDFNCPFCYAQQHRLRQLNLLECTEWRLIQHAPQASSSQSSLHDLAELTSEVTQLRRRAPDIPIQIPRFRPNSGLANELYMAARKLNPKQAIEFRSLIYSALWQQGKDISRSAVLQQLWKEAGLPKYDPASQTEQEAVTSALTEWQQQWEAGDFDRRIPSMVDAQGERLLGLPTISRLANYMKGQGTEEDADMTCEAKVRQRVLVLSESNALQRLITNCISPFADVEYSHESNYQEQLESWTPDLIVADLDCYDGEIEQFMELLAGNLRTTPPAILASVHADPVDEAEAFNSGAVDFFRLPILASVIRARLKAHLKTKLIADQLNILARIDQLTGLENRREFDLVLTTEWRRCQRLAHALSVLIVDIDCFRLFNQHFGHGEGDECLRMIASTVADCLHRAGDCVSRISGEEFAMILPNTGREGAVRVAEKVRSAVSDLSIPHPQSTVAHHVTVSVGGSCVIPHPNYAPKDLLHTANLALHQAKQKGRNCSFFLDNWND